MFDAEVIDVRSTSGISPGSPTPKITIKSSPRYYAIKRALDFFAARLLVPFTLSAARVLVVLNPFLNKGTLLYRQTRMGKNCEPFTAYKFRTMKEAAGVNRGAFDALEEDRITKLGTILRKLRIDELPQIINILKGDMSLVGPRPDMWEHAEVYLQEIPGYRDRHQVLPGVTGLAQTEVGYVSDEQGFRRKVAADLTYIHRMTLRYDLRVILRTVQIVVARHGK